jgi:hypothetical protein
MAFLMSLKDSGILSHFVAAYRRKHIALRIATVSLTALFFLLTLLALLQIIFSLFPWTLLPLFFDCTCVLAALSVIAYITTEMTFRAPTLSSVARMIEQRSGLRRPYLAVSLELSGDARARDNPFTEEACSRAVAELASSPRAPSRPRYAIYMSIIALALGSWCFLNPILAPRLLDYWGLPFVRSSARDAVVTPGSVVVPANATVTMVLAPRAARYPSCRLTITALDGRRLAGPLLRPDANGAFAYRLDSVRNSFVYRFAPGGVALRDDTVTVVSPPRLTRVSVTVRPPAYTHRPERMLPEGQGSFDAYAGSRARITIESDRLSAAWLVRDRDSLRLALQGKVAFGEFTMAQPCNYTFALIDTLGQKNDSLPYFHVGSIVDEPPMVHIVKPGYNKDLEPEQVETLAVEGVDDLGIDSLALNWRLCGERQGASGRYDFSEPGTPPVIRTDFIWHLTELSLYPGDTVRYYAEVKDTRPFGKPQRSVSDTFWFRIPGFEEIHRKIAQREMHAEKTVGAVRGRQGELQEQLENVVKAASGQKELTWEQKQVLRDVKKGFEAQADSLGRALESLRENVEKMKQEGSVGEELAQKFDKVRKAVDDLVKQYGDSLLFNMKDVEKPVSWRDLRQAIEKVQAMLPKLNEQLDNVLKYLEMLKADRKLAELAQRAEQLSREQSALARGERRNDAVAERQKELLDRIRELSKSAREQSASGRAPSKDSLKAKAMVDSLQKAMQGAMERSAMPSRETMNQMSGALLSLSQDLMQRMNSNEAMRMERERERLLSLSRDALALAEWQDEVAGDPVASRDASAAAQSQQGLKDALKKSRASADSLSMLSPDDLAAIGQGFTQAMAASENVLEALGSGDGRSSMAGSGTALRSLAGSLLSALSHMENEPQSKCSGGACMMPGLRRLSGRQAAINSATAEMLRQLLGGSSGQSASDQAGKEGGAEGGSEARSAARKAQQAIADELKKLSDQYGKEAGEGLRSKVGDLEEEARRLAAMLERPSPEITERQDRFLARMLETTLSMHREGEGKDEWKSRTAEKIFDNDGAERPGAFFKDADLFHRLRQRAFQGNFPDGYRNALKEYFDALSEKYLK